MFQGPWLKPWLLSNSAILICNVYHLPPNTPPFLKNLPRSVPVLTAFKKSYCILSWLRKRRIWTSSRIVAGAAATALKYELHLHRSRPELDFLNYRTSFLFCFVLELVYSYIFLMLRLFRGLLFLPAKPLFFFSCSFPSFQCGWAAEENVLQDCLCAFSPDLKHLSPFLCPQHHQIIQQYMVTLENLLFTAELDPHILAVFQQFCALQA